MQKACSYRDKNSGTYQQPQWASNAKNRQQYIPSHNIAPTDVTPVLVSGSYFGGESERMLQSMMWGMIPIWHKVISQEHAICGGAFEVLDVLFIMSLRTASLSHRKPACARTSSGNIHVQGFDVKDPVLIYIFIFV